MKKFEYKRIYREVGDRELEMIGELGWELVSVEPSKSGIPPHPVVQERETRS